MSLTLPQEPAAASCCVIAMFALGAGIAAYILAHQRLRFPLVEEAPLKLKMELANAQAVAPGQGQTVRVSGVQIGEIGRRRAARTATPWWSC